MARPTKYDPYTESTIVKYISEGYTQADAAQMAGINPDTLYEWAKKYPDFSDSIKKAVIKSKQVLIKKIKEHGNKDWKANAWLLERRFPQEYAIKQIMEHTGKVEQSITVNVVPFIPHGATQDQLERIREAYGDEAFTKGMEHHLNRTQVIEGQLDTKPSIDMEGTT